MTLFLSVAFTMYWSGILNCVLANNKNLINFLIAAEIMFLGLDLLFIGTGLMFNSYYGVIFAFIIILLTVGESAIGLGLCVISLKLNNFSNFSNLSALKY